MKDLKRQLESTLKKGDLKLLVQSPFSTPSHTATDTRTSLPAQRPRSLGFQKQGSDTSLQIQKGSTKSDDATKGTLSPAVSVPFDEK